jgi:hypothetical protein
LPAAVEFNDEFRDHRDEFEIFAFHSPSAKTFEELDRKMASIVEKQWGGRALPFPILLDATGESLRRFSIKALGTHVLIDPDGKVVEGEGLKTLEERLRKSIARARDGG